ncbi:hypothetical protein D3C85_1646170 [compost metagenome]
MIVLQNTLNAIIENNIVTAIFIKLIIFNDDILIDISVIACATFDINACHRSRSSFTANIMEGTVLHDDILAADYT